MTNREEIFAELYSSHQHRLYGYLFAILRNRSDAQDVLQQTAIVLWQKFDKFDCDTDFFRWASVVARYEALNFVKYRRRSRVYFNDDLMEALAADQAELATDEELGRREALSTCLTKLPNRDRQIMESYYAHGLGSRQIGEVLGRSASSVCNSLRRIREALMICIESSIAQEEHK